jgi:hypothetical protein
MTTAPHGDLRRRDLHPLVKQLASLRSLHRVPRNGSPNSTVLRDAPTPVRPSRRTSLPSFGDTTLASCLLPATRRGAVGSGELLCRFPSRACQWRRTGLSGSRAPLVSLRPVLGPRWDRTRQAIAACRHGPRMCLRRRLPRGVFRGSIARHWDSLSTLRSEGRPSPRKTRFRPLAELCRAGFVNPQGRDKRFPCSSHFLLSRAFLTQRHPQTCRSEQSTSASILGASRRSEFDRIKASVMCA